MKRFGFEHQWSFSGSCARHALRHALLCIGVAPTEKELSQALGRGRLRTGVFGTDEESLKQGVENFGCRAEEIYRSSAKKTRQQIDWHLDRNAPVIACGDQWDHWALFCGRDEERYFWIDSDKRALVGTSSWKEMRDWLCCDGEERPYYAIAVVPDEKQLGHSLVPSMPDAADYIKGRSNRGRWGEYVFALQSVLADDGQPAKAFFSEREEEILGYARPRNPRSRVLVKRLQRLQAIATFHNFRISVSLDAQNSESASKTIARQLVDLS